MSVNKSNILNITYLELKPLSQISDEDINFVAKVCHQVPNLTFEINFDYKIIIFDQLKIFRIHNCIYILYNNLSTARISFP